MIMATIWIKSLGYGKRQERDTKVKKAMTSQPDLGKVVISFTYDIQDPQEQNRRIMQLHIPFTVQAMLL